MHQTSEVNKSCNVVKSTQACFSSSSVFIMICLWVIYPSIMPIDDIKCVYDIHDIFPRFHEYANVSKSWTKTIVGVEKRKRKRKLQRALYIRLDKTKWHLSKRERHVGIFYPKIKCSMVLKWCKNMKTLYKVCTWKTMYVHHKKPRYIYD